MSTDTLLRSLEHNAEAVGRLVHGPRLFAAIVIPEGDGDIYQFPLDQVLRTHLSQDIGVNDAIDLGTQSSIRETSAVCVFGEAEVPLSDLAAAHERYRGLAARLLSCLARMEHATLARLGLDFHGTLPSSWIRVLFHLCWHFPEHFAGGAPTRYRVLVNGKRTFTAPEDLIQLWGCNFTEDRWPGLIFSRFLQSLDLVSATEYAIALFRTALIPSNSPAQTDEHRARFQALCDEFETLGRSIQDLSTTSGGEALLLRR